MSPNLQQINAQKNLQRKINYQFKNNDLLTQALTHRSFGAHNYERLEFIGDSILDYVIAKMLYENFPKLPEGRLSPIRAQLVQESSLAEIARELHIGSALLLGIGELKSGGHDKASILADTLEAIFAAVSLDSDFQAAEKIIYQLFQNKINNLDTTSAGTNPKTQLQETLQIHRHPLPKYRIEQQIGEGNDVRFTVSCDLGELGYISYATATSRRAAEQECAKQAIVWLEQHFRQPEKRKKS